MDTVKVEEKAMAVMKGDGTHKHIVIFGVMPMVRDQVLYTTLLVTKMSKFAKENDINVTIKIVSASKIGEEGQEANVVLLSPELFSMEEQVKGQYPNVTVRVIDKKAYGLLEVENILYAALA